MERCLKRGCMEVAINENRAARIEFYEQENGGYHFMCQWKNGEKSTAVPMSFEGATATAIMILALLPEEIQKAALRKIEQLADERANQVEDDEEITEE